MKGFTLIEVLLYIALLAIFLSGTFFVVNQMLVNGSRNQTAMAVQQEGMFLTDKMQWALDGANAVQVSHQGKQLTITKTGLGSDSPLVVDGSGAVITLKRGAGLATPLHSTFFTLSDVDFSIGSDGMISIAFSLNGTLFSLQHSSP